MFSFEELSDIHLTLHLWWSAMRTNVPGSVRRAQACMENDGEHFEHLSCKQQKNIFIW